MANLTKSAGGFRKRTILSSYKDSQRFEDGTYLNSQVLQDEANPDPAPYLNGVENATIRYNKAQMDRIMENSQVYRNDETKVNYLLTEVDLMRGKTKDNETVILMRVPTDPAKAEKSHLAKPDMKLDKNLINRQTRLTEEAKAKLPVKEQKAAQIDAEAEANQDLEHDHELDFEM